MAAIYGPLICGDAIDIYHDGYTVLTGSYRQDDCIQLWDLRTRTCSRVIGWDGPDAGSSLFNDENNDINGERRKNRPREAPFLYTTAFSKKQDLVLAGGAGKNELRVFDY